MKHKDYVWKTKEGVEINIKNMNDGHVLNCLTGLKEKRIYPLREKKRIKWINIFTKELRIRKYNKLL
jgi:hypothetical protein